MDYRQIKYKNTYEFHSLLFGKLQDLKTRKNSIMGEQITNYQKYDFCTFMRIHYSEFVTFSFMWRGSIFKTRTEEGGQNLTKITGYPLRITTLLKLKLYLNCWIFEILNEFSIIIIWICKISDSKLWNFGFFNTQFAILLFILLVYEAIL